jgi:hypothetical protein
MALQLERIEENLLLQNHRITALYDQINLLISLIAGDGNDERNNRRTSTATTSATFQGRRRSISQEETNNDELKNTLLTATPETLHELSGILSDLASGDASSVKSLNSLFKHFGTNVSASFFCRCWFSIIDFSLVHNFFLYFFCFLLGNAVL